MEDRVIFVISLLGALTTLIGAISSMRSSEKKSSVDQARIDLDENKNIQEIISMVNAETVGMTMQLSKQYSVITEKDRKLLRVVTSVIRKLMVMQRSIVEIVDEIEKRLHAHADEASDIGCPYYLDIDNYTISRLKLLLVMA